LSIIIKSKVLDEGVIVVEFKTDRVPVRIFTSSFEIEGNVHIKLGGYLDRISDVLNLGKTKYLPITETKYRIRSDNDGEFTQTDCLIVNIGNVEMIDVMEP